ncbi:hypothetical protein GCM10028820_18240 [Tessaracoccus terricola]
MIDVLDALRSALGLEAGLYRDYTSATMWAALGVALIAGASTMLGHVAILLLNRISGLRLVTSLLLSFLTLAFLYASQGAVTWAVATVALRRPLPLVPLIAVALLALAPLAFNFITALPHLGLGIGRVLQAWSFLVLWFGVGVTFQLTWPWALGFTIAGWVVMQLLARFLDRPFNWLYSRLWSLATGRPTMATSQDILSGMPIIPVVGK